MKCFFAVPDSVAEVRQLGRRGDTALESREGRVVGQRARPGLHNHLRGGSYLEVSTVIFKGN
jgi:hypothetical protein